MEQQANVDISYAWRVLELFASYGDELAIVADDVRLTYARARAGTLAVTRALRDHGVRPGSALGVLVSNPHEAIFLQLGAHLLGCRTAWIAPNAPDRYRTDFLRMAEVDAFVYDPREYAEMGEQLHAAVGIPALCLGPGGVGPDLLATPVPDAVPVDPAEVRTEPSSLFQTGGTTGRPKLVHQGHQFFTTLLALSDLYLAAGEPPIRHLATSGFWHVSGQVPAFMTLCTGGVFVTQNVFTVETVLQAIEQERITSFLLPPPLLSYLLDHPMLDKTDLSSLHMLSVGGAAAAPARLAEAIERIGPVLRPVYGASEAPFIAALPRLGSEPEHLSRLDSCGLPYGDMRIEIRADDGTVLPTGRTGEVWVTGSLLMRGYWGEPELTARTLVDGWLRTGDVGRLDEQGYLFLVDRVKDMIITGYGSTNVFCRPVEDCLASHPQVRHAAVIGVPSEKFGEAVHAVVVRTPGAEVTGDELRALVAQQLNELWAPASVEFVESLPLTDANKVDKKALRAAYADRRG